MAYENSFIINFSSKINLFIIFLITVFINLIFLSFKYIFNIIIRIKTSTNFFKVIKIFF